jgi:hypothetical protein
MLTRHFSLEEMTASETAARKGLDNSPSPEILDALIVTANGLERVREELGGKPIHINSGYRSAKVNAAVGGKATSQHVKGEAADIICPAFGPPSAVARAIEAAKDRIGYDQLIYEFHAWVHISFTDAPRGMVLTINSKGVQQGIIA